MQSILHNISMQIPRSATLRLKFSELISSIQELILLVRKWGALIEIRMAGIIMQIDSGKF